MEKGKKNCLTCKLAGNCETENNRKQSGTPFKWYLKYNCAGYEKSKK